MRSVIIEGDKVRAGMWFLNPYTLKMHLIKEIDEKDSRVMLFLDERDIWVCSKDDWAGHPKPKVARNKEKLEAFITAERL